MMGILSAAKKHKLALYIVLISIVKIVLSGNLPVYIIPNAYYDDKLMVLSSISLLRLNWLGSYTNMTLVKGFFFPLFLSVSKLFSVPYLTATAIFYAVSCCVFIAALKGVFKNKIYYAILFTVLLFNPITLDLSAFQRVYRNSIVPAEVLLVFGSMFAVYLRREETLKKLLPWLGLAGLSLAALWFTREDSIWALPFVLVCGLVTAGVMIKRFVSTKQHAYITKAVFSFLPPAILALCILSVSAVNYARYGLFTTNELTGSNFTKALQSIYAVQPADNIDYVSVPRSTVDKLYSVSPTLSSIRPEMEKSLDAWGTSTGQHPDDKEVEDGWFQWAFRDAVADAGYYKNAATSQEFYLKVHNEIEQAFKDARLLKRPTMPSALMSPWKTGYGTKLLQASSYAMGYVVNYTDVSPGMVVSDKTQMDDDRLFEFVTGNQALFDDALGQSLKPAYSKLIQVDAMVAKAYRVTGKPLFICSLVCFLFIAILAVTKRKAKDTGCVAVLLFLSSLILSVILLILGVSYVHISAYPAINQMYLCAAYPLVAAFIATAILFTVQSFIDLLRKGSNNHV